MASSGSAYVEKISWTIIDVSEGDVSMSSFVSRTVVSYDSLFVNFR